MTNSIADPIKTYAFTGHSGARAVVVMRGLRCPRCATELTADDVHADSFGTTALQCGHCHAIILAVV